MPCPSNAQSMSSSGADRRIASCAADPKGASASVSSADAVRCSDRTLDDGGWGQWGGRKDDGDSNKGTTLGMGSNPTDVRDGCA